MRCKFFLTKPLLYARLQLYQHIHSGRWLENVESHHVSRTDCVCLTLNNEARFFANQSLHRHLLHIHHSLCLEYCLLLRPSQTIYGWSRKSELEKRIFFRVWNYSSRDFNHWEEWRKESNQNEHFLSKLDFALRVIFSSKHQSSNHHEWRFFNASNDTLAKIFAQCFNIRNIAT